MAEKNKSADQDLQPDILSRRNFLAATAGVAAVACSPAEQEKAQANIANATATAEYAHLGWVNLENSSNIG